MARKLPTPEPIDIVEDLFLRRGYRPHQIIDLCRQIAQADSGGDWRKEYWPWQLREMVQIALMLDDWLSTHKAGS